MKFVHIQLHERKTVPYLISISCVVLFSKARFICTGRIYHVHCEKYHSEVTGVPYIEGC